ncbi:conserved hypothetical protein [Neospora caninum Liverpool]|uniref:Sugar phosphate phosphatase n=1 Tax=Neospora caninum (strain Liverpool) TaxID=572307 RepID=F0VNC9_NEOCL|nr:conserved hypothetical protein [Neospora caninum Liverpool]CBZ55225.1 conserved hypothetical protein [Neospora caninum Liverpool]CEL69952.1 TPA: DUF89/Fructose bisphosphatase [Neospora caninum Liverpool]|eukprot:XP_003885253.1 conserved hypothetical protein [Neospora caninum Liverpool]
MTWTLHNAASAQASAADENANLLDQYNDMQDLHQCRPSSAGLPPVTLSDEPGTWSYNTMNSRLRDDILKRIFDENKAFLEDHPQCLHRLRALDAEMAESLTSPLQYLSAVEESEKEAGESNAYSVDVEKADVQLWNDILAKWVEKGATWATAPWLVAELYFYRRVAHAFRHFTTRYDPFEKQKHAGLRGCVPMLLRFGESLQRMHGTTGCTSNDPLVFKAGLRSAIVGALQGNAADLSLWPCNHHDAEVEMGQDTTASSTLGEDDDTSRLLCDDFEAFFEDVQTLVALGGSAQTQAGEKRQRSAFIFVDNAGSEVVTDMWLACVLLEYKVVDKIVFYVKQYPIFVSDALPKDFQLTYDWIQQQATAARTSVAALADLWRSYVESGKWEVKAHAYFCMPFEYSEMPSKLYKELRDNAAVVISKGDANYRHILGDRAWSMQTPFSEVAQYMPCPLLALRKLKGNIACGIPAEQERHAQQADKCWMVNGKWGVIHYYSPRQQNTTAV